MSQFPENEFEIEKVKEYLNKSQEYISPSEKYLNGPMDSAQDADNADPLAFLNGLIQEDQKLQEAHDKKKEEQKIKEEEEEEEEDENDPLAKFRKYDLRQEHNKLKPRKKNDNPAKKAVKKLGVVKPRVVPEALTWSEVNEAAKEFFYVRRMAYEARQSLLKKNDNYNRNATWSELSTNQKIKRKRKGVVKQALRDEAIDFLNSLEEEKELQGAALLTNDPTEQEINTFLGINLDQFHFNNDQEFIDHLDENFMLTDRVEAMERFLERVVTGESVLPPERVEPLSKQVTLLKEIKEWMEARLELISDPYYVLLSSRELTDSAQILEGLDAMEQKGIRPSHPNEKETTPNIRQFLQRYERVKNCTFNRRRFRDQLDENYRTEFRTQMDAKGIEKSQDIARRKQMREERETREHWQATAKQIALAEKTSKPPLRQEPATMELFDEKRKAFMEINLDALHFGSIEEILTNHAAHNALFEQAKEMQRILTDVSQDEHNNIPDQTLIPLRARLQLFFGLRRRQTKVICTLTEKGGELGNMSLAEWIKTHDLLLGIDPKIEEQKYLDDFTAQNDHAEGTIREMYDQLKPGQEMPLDQLARIKDHFQKNLIFWESMKYAKMELSAQDEETMAFLNSYYQSRNQDVPEISRRLMIHLRGKSKEETEEILKKYTGTPAEQMQLEKEMADLALSEVKQVEEYRLNTGNPASFTKDFIFKLHQSERMLCAGESLEKIEELRKANPDAPLPEGYQEEYQKEIRALCEFAKDHIEARMNSMAGVAEQTKQEFLGAMELREFKTLKEDRDGISKDLKKPAEEQHRAAKTAAEVFFATADQLLKNEKETVDYRQGERQRVASAEMSMDAIYQSYRLANGIKELVSEYEAQKRKMLEQINGISESSLYSSREELQSLRDLCITALSEYEKDVPEYHYYDLPTETLKELATRKLKENLSAKEINSVIDRCRKMGLRREQEEEQPEWGEKEKNALSLMGDMAGMEEKEKEDGQELLTLLDSHAEVLADMAHVAMSDPKKRSEDLKRYRELKQKIEIGEHLKTILQEEEENLKVTEKLFEIAKTEKKKRKAEEEKGKAEKNKADKEKADKEKAARDKAESKNIDSLNRRVNKHKAEVESIRERMNDFKANENAYRKELKELSYLDAAEREIEDKELALNKTRDSYDRLMREMKAPSATAQDKELDQKLHDLHHSMDEVIAKYKDSGEENANERDNELEKIAAEIKNLENTKKERKKEERELKQLQKAEAEKLKRIIEEQETELEKLKADPEVSLNVFGCLGRRLEGPDGILAKEIGAGLSGVVGYLVKKSGEKVLRLSSIRRLLKSKDPELTKLLAEAKSRIKTSMEKAYQDICADVKGVVPFMFDDLSVVPNPLGYETKVSETGTVPIIKAYYQQQYSEKDWEEDRLKALESRQAAKKKLAQLKEKVEAGRQALEAEKQKLEEKKQKLEPKDVELFKQREAKLQDDYQRSYREVVKEHKAEVSNLGPDARFLKQADKMITGIWQEEEKKPDITLEILQNQNWTYKPTEDKKTKKKSKKGAPVQKEQPGEGAFVRNVMLNYFDKVSVQDKKAMMKSMLYSLKPMIRDHKHVRTNSLKRTSMYLAGLLRGAGPLMQKLMQGVPERYLLTELAVAVEDMKSNLEPIPDSYVKGLFDKMRKDSGGKITDIQKLQSLGAASVGQAFLCRVKGPDYPEGKQVVIKILRPEVGKRIDREKQIMLDCAKATSEGMLATYAGQLSKVDEELDLTKEADNCRQGVKAYEKGDGKGEAVCRSVHVMEDIKPDKEYLVLDKAEGETVDRYLKRVFRKRKLLQKPFRSVSVNEITGKKNYVHEVEITSENVDKIPEVRQELVKELQSMAKRREHLEKVTELWIKESVFGGGFYHGDMHAGNLMVNDLLATILDYGNATKMKPEEVKTVLALSGTAMYGDARTFLDKFLESLPADQLARFTGEDQKDPKAAFAQMKKFTILKNKLRKKIYRIFSRGNKSQTGDKMELALTELQKEGFQIPIAVYSFVQSQVRLNNTLRDLNKLEYGIREDINRLDHSKANYATTVKIDFLLQAQSAAVQSNEPENYFRALYETLQEPNEDEFVKLITDTRKDREGKTEFQKKYMVMLDRINRLMDGLAPKPKGFMPEDFGDTEEEDAAKKKEQKENPEYVPIPQINIEEWKKEYEEYMQLFEQDRLLDERVSEEVRRKRRPDKSEYDKSQIHRDCEKAQRALIEKLNAVFMATPYNSNGLVDGFGGHYELMGKVGDAVAMGNRQAFLEIVDLFEHSVLPLIQLARDMRDYLNSPKKTVEESKRLFAAYKKMTGMIAEQHKAFADPKSELSYDRRFYLETDKADILQYYQIQKDDTTQFKEIFPVWKELYDRKKAWEEAEDQKALKKEGEAEEKEAEDNKEDVKEPKPLTQEEEERLSRLGMDLRQCRRIARAHEGVRVRDKEIPPMLKYWFMDKLDGKALYQAYTNYVALQKRDMENRDKQWDDDSALADRMAAEARFFTIYRRIAFRRLKNYMEAYRLKVPPQKHEVLRDFNNIFEDVVYEGSYVERIKKAKTLGNAVGMEKGMAYYFEKYVPGLDLEDTVPKQQGEKPEVIIREVPWNEEEEQKEKEKEEQKQKEKEDAPDIDTSTKSKNKIMEKEEEDNKNRIILDGESDDEEEEKYEDENNQNEIIIRDKNGNRIYDK